LHFQRNGARLDMGDHLEIERKFLLKSFPPGWRRRPHSRIVQGYFPLASHKLEMRLRHKDDQRFITIKGGRGRIRLEEEFKIPKKRFDSLWPFTEGCISKTRYRIPCHGKMIEMDVYDGRHRGLVTVDIEFKSRREAAGFRVPDWFGREITGNWRYANERLAKASNVKRLIADARRH